MPVILTPGPLSKRQRKLLQMLANGCTQAEAAKYYRVTPQTINADVRMATFRLGANTSTESVAIWARANTLREVADRIGRARVVTPLNESEEFLNSVLTDFAAKLESDARHLDTVISVRYRELGR